MERGVIIGNVETSHGIWRQTTYTHQSLRQARKLTASIKNIAVPNPQNPKTKQKGKKINKGINYKNMLFQEGGV